jgi:hypothetical protein
MSNVRPHTFIILAMSLCPRCNEPHGRAELRVWCATSWWPARCSNCGARFHPARTTSAVVAELAFFPFGLVASAASPTLAVAAVFIVGFIVAYLAVRAFVPLVAAESS